MVMEESKLGHGKSWKSRGISFPRFLWEPCSVALEVSRALWMPSHYLVLRHVTYFPLPDWFNNFGEEYLCNIE